VENVGSVLGSPYLRGEDEIVVLPNGTNFQPILLLTGTVGAQPCDEEPRNGDFAAGLFRLGRYESPLPILLLTMVVALVLALVAGERDTGERDAGDISRLEIKVRELVRRRSGRSGARSRPSPRQRCSSDR
jgi:hypothetical protein